MDYPTWKSLIPYGKWTCADGREVLFNRENIGVYAGRATPIADDRNRLMQLQLAVLRPDVGRGS
jgi:hypothetical protein